MMHRSVSSGDSNAVCISIVPGDESGNYCCGPKTKRQSAQWIVPFEELPTKVKRVRSVGKIWVASFFEMTGAIILWHDLNQAQDKMLPVIGVDLIVSRF
ncbi:hypothetical protein EVAR_32595_1 [Eumeta japonica]|uniref:Uncharacterized protein n=1 Tax=Eumeta variegata TaxID=151549 RepID=A0A4C1WHK9_EUMVA|nr:hypothetical protein EVAR_32595_1 [Eumeta japonica]